MLKKKLNFAIEEDPRIKSKCTTPKQFDVNLGSYFSRTQEKVPNYLHQKKKEELRNEHNFEIILEDKIKKYEIISGTLGQYMRQQKSKDKNKVMSTAIQIIKAFSKTQIKEVSPNVNKLIQKILDSFPLPSKAKKKRKSMKSEKQDEKHRSQRSKSEMIKQLDVKADNRDWVPIYHNEIASQISGLQQNLNQLRDQCQILKEIKLDFDTMNEEQKEEYIKELEEIVDSQQKILDDLKAQADE